MRQCVWQSDTVIRRVGDEFTIILEGRRGVDDAKAFAGKLVEMLRAPIAFAGKLFVVTTPSFSVAQMRRSTKPNDEDAMEQSAGASRGYGKSSDYQGCSANRSTKKSSKARTAGNKCLREVYRA